MQETAKYLCENIQGCQLAYTQSDEISLLLIDYQRFETLAWFDYEIQKMCSISASMVTFVFNKLFTLNFNDLMIKAMRMEESDEETTNYLRTLEKANINGAMFDARAFNIPREEVTNYFYWRQLDASRNSIQMVGQSNLTHAQLQYKSCNDIQDMLMTQKGINWNDFPTHQKRGSCVVKEKYWVDGNDGCEYSKEYQEVLNRTGGNETDIQRSRWYIDKDIPIFKGEGRDYIERLVNVGEA